MPSGQTPELVLPSVAVSAFGSDVAVTNSPDEQGGVGVTSGALPEFIEPGQQVLFRFVKDDRPRSARDVAYRVHAGPGVLGPIPGEMQVELFDHEGLLLDSGMLTGLGTRELSQLFAAPNVSAFTLSPLNHPLRVSGLVYTLNPPCSDGLDNDGDGLVDFDGAGGAPDLECEGTPIGGERGPACGLGFEVVPLLLLWRRGRRRRTR